MTCIFRNFRSLAVVAIAVMAVSCREKNRTSTPAAKSAPEVSTVRTNAAVEAARLALFPPSKPYPMVVGREMEELGKFFGDTRALFDSRKYAALESLANRIRSGKERTASGGWRIVYFYGSLNGLSEEPESQWKLHDEIHREWIAQYPKSITARVARAEFLIAYAWHARGDGYAEKVTQPGWRLFGERLAEARTVLEQSSSLVPACPVWGLSRLMVALGQGETPARFDALYQAAKKSEPQFVRYDIVRAQFLLPRWHGQPGDWEAAAEKEINRPGGLGIEGYARVVDAQSEYFTNVFKESKASWEKTRKGFDEMRARYPDSKILLNTFCRLACVAGDRELAKKLFAEIGDDKIQGVWNDQGPDAAGFRFQLSKDWADGKK